MKNHTEMTYEEHIAQEEMLDEHIREWYMNTYPTDECGKYLNENATFGGLFITLDTYKDVYDYIGEGDSVIRERCFARLAEIMDCDYDYIYEQWIMGARVRRG